MQGSLNPQADNLLKSIREKKQKKSVYFINNNLNFLKGNNAFKQ